VVAGRNDRLTRRRPAVAGRDFALAGIGAKANGGAMAERQIWRGLGEVLAASPLFLFAPFYRRQHLRWGANDAELHESMPGDEVLPNASFNTTRAITIDAPPDAVWPWIVQIGYGRAGWYSYDLFDNAGRPSAEHVLPEYQHPQVGDWVPMFAKVNAATAFKIKAFEPNEWMLWDKPNSTWAWRLKRLKGGRTRLVTRLRQKYDWESPGGALLTAILMEFGDFPMMRRELKGIRRRAEANFRGAESSSLHVPG
jgi:hypothetical protein